MNEIKRENETDKRRPPFTYVTVGERVNGPRVIDSANTAVDCE